MVANGVEWLAPVLATWARRQTVGEPLPPQRWKRALILGANHIGDLLYRTASLEALKKGLPNCDFYYLTAPATAEILAGQPSLQAVLPFARSESLLDLSHDHRGALRDLRFDAALCTNSSSYWAQLLLAIRLGIPSRVGYTHKGFSGWVTHPTMRYPQSFPRISRLRGSRDRQDPTWPLRPRCGRDAAEKDARARGSDTAWKDRPIARVLCATRQPTRCGRRNSSAEHWRTCAWASANRTGRRGPGPRAARHDQPRFWIGRGRARGRRGTQVALLPADEMRRRPRVGFRPAPYRERGRPPGVLRQKHSLESNRNGQLPGNRVDRAAGRVVPASARRECQIVPSPSPTPSSIDSARCRPYALA